MAGEPEGGLVARPERIEAAPGHATLRLHALTGLRWWAAFWVFCHHLLNYTSVPLVLLLPMRIGHLGVTFFFVLSGFVLTWSWASKVRISTFYTRRFARIYPSHFVALLIAIPVFYATNPNPAHSWVKPWDLGVVSLSVPLLQGWSRDPDVLFSGNPAAWTLSCEAFFYALHPLVMMALARMRARGALWLALGSLGMAVVYRWICLGSPDAWWAAGMPWPIARFPEFVVGMGLAWAMRHGWRPRIPHWLGWGVFGGALVLLSVASYRTYLAPAARFTNEIMLAACALIIAVVAAHAAAGKRSLLATRPLVALGNWSYAFYLVHSTVIYAVLNLVGPAAGRTHTIGGSAALLGASIGLAFVLHRWVEIPLERRIRAWKDARDRHYTSLR